jgi:hypothetical protein
MTKLRRGVLPTAVLALLCAFCNRNVGGNRVGPSPLRDGDECNFDSDCASFSCSGGVTGDDGITIATNTCMPPAMGLVEIDGPCSGSDACVADAICEDGVCVENTNGCAPVGPPCGNDVDCCSSNCDATGHCAACLPSGAPSDSQCDGCCSHSCVGNGPTSCE